MANVDAVKNAIENLTAVEYIELQHWLEENDSAEQPIDYQLKADLDSGKIDDLLNQAMSDHEAGRTKPL